MRPTGWLHWLGSRGHRSRSTLSLTCLWAVYLAIPSAASQSFDNKTVAGQHTALLLILTLMARIASAQLTTGLAEGNLRAPDGHVLAGTLIVVAGAVGFETDVRTSSSGQFARVLPYGWYRFSL